MAIRFRLKEVLDARGLTQTDLHQRTQLAYSTVSELYHNKARRIDLGTLESLCKALGCTVGELVEYVPEKRRHRT